MLFPWRCGTVWTSCSWVRLHLHLPRPETNQKYTVTPDIGGSAQLATHARYKATLSVEGSRDMPRELQVKSL